MSTGLPNSTSSCRSVSFDPASCVWGGGVSWGGGLGANNAIPGVAGSGRENDDATVKTAVVSSFFFFCCEGFVEHVVEEYEPDRACAGNAARGARELLPYSLDMRESARNVVCGQTHDRLGCVRVEAERRALLTEHHERERRVLDDADDLQRERAGRREPAPAFTQLIRDLPERRLGRRPAEQPHRLEVDGDAERSVCFVAVARGARDKIAGGARTTVRRELAPNVAKKW